jgi:hypothetical protein
MSDMTSGTHNKFVTRFIALVFMGLAFAGCAVVLSNGERSLLTDVNTTTVAG